MANTHSITLVRASSQYLTAADSASLSPTGNITMEAWVKVTTLQGNGIGCPIIFKGDYNSDNAYQLYYNNNAGAGQVVCRIWSGVGNANYCSSLINYTLTVGTWIHVACVVTVANAIGTKFEFFINGVSQGNGTTSVTGTAPTSIYDSATNFAIGAMSNPTFLLTTYCLDAKIDEVRLWNTARSGAQIAANYATELVGNESGLQGYWKLNNALTDSTSNGNTLTNNGSASFSTDIPTWSNNYTQSVLETVTLNEIFSRVFTASRSLPEAVTLVDTVNKTKVAVKSFVEVIDLIETMVVRISGKYLAEVVTLVETFAKQITINRVLTEVVTLVEAFNKSIVKITSLLESITLVDVISKATAIGLRLLETITITIRYLGLLNGKDMRYLQKYLNKAGTYVKKYLNIPDQE